MDGGQELDVFTARGCLTTVDARAGVVDSLSRRMGKAPFGGLVVRRPLLVVGLSTALAGFLAYALAAVSGGWDLVAPAIKLLLYVLFGALGVFAAVLTICLVVVPRSLLRQRAFSEERVYSLTDEGLRAESDSSEGVVKWHGIVDVGRTDDHVFVYISRESAHVLPRHFFADTEAFDGFHRELVRRRGARVGELPEARVVADGDEG